MMDWSLTARPVARLFLDGRHLETAWWGPSPDAAPTLVLLHEGLGCVALWRDFPAALVAATGCGVFAWSRFGYGGSGPAELPRPMTYMHDEALTVLPRVLDAAGVRRAILIGHSDGGSIAAIYAGAVPDARVAGAVLIAAHFFVEDINIASIAAIKADYEQGDLRQRLARYHRDVDMAFRGWNDAWLDSRFRVFDISGHAARIEVPILALQGADDPYGTAEQLRVLERCATCPVQTRLIAGARHAPHLEAREATLAAIVPFFRGVLMEAAA
jgi:pimeloyl-ACP methyl ester carboxylesterase